VDIKDFILIGGGLLIAAVVAHGFWIAWRDRRQDLRIDIKPDLIPEELNEIDRLRGELPNGGSRMAKSSFEDPQQDTFVLEQPPFPEHGETPTTAERRIEPAIEDTIDELIGVATDTDPAGTIDDPEDATNDAAALAATDVTTDEREAAQTRPAVAEVSLPEPIVADEPRRPRRLGQRRAAAAEEPREASTAAAPVEELIVMNVLAEPGNPYAGDELFTAMRECGLKFGDMNIFHRIDPLTKIVQYSVASAVEPGTFDVAEIEALRCPGLCLFMQLPGPENPTTAFEDMLSVARSVTRSHGGEVKDEHRNVMTPQTVEHYRQRIVDFSRRRMSKRA